MADFMNQPNLIVSSNEFKRWTGIMTPGISWENETGIDQSSDSCREYASSKSTKRVFKVN